MTVEVRVSDSVEIRVLGDVLDNLGDVLDGLGALLTQRSQATFREQGKGKRPWPPRIVPNFAGIISDLNAGGFPKGRRFEPRPALVDRGILRNSITWEVAADGKSVVVGTSVPYARIQNEGGESTITLTPAGREKLTALIRSDPEGAGFGLGFLFRKPELKTQVRERRFLDIDDDDRKLIVKTLEDGLGGAVKVKNVSR